MNATVIRAYYHLTKPRMVQGNTLIAACGFFLASRGHIDFGLLFAILVGLSLVIASACAINNFIDKDIDKLMVRTKYRALVTKIIPGRNALIFGTALCILGFAILAFYTNFTTVLFAGLGGFFYLIMYSFWKRRSIHGTFVGSISGATPPVIGYVTVTNTIDLGAILLFIILVLWQMPHFYAIAIYRFDDYANASIPVLPVKKGFAETKAAMLLYILAFIVATLTLYFFGYTGILYLIVAIILGLSWLILCIKGFTTNDTKRWARKMFFLSLIVLMLLFITIAIDSFIKF